MKKGLLLIAIISLFGLSNAQEFQCPHSSYKGGLCTIGNKVYTMDGCEFKFYGVNRGQLEGNFPNAYGQWIVDPTDPNGSIWGPGFDSIAAWGVNHIRVPLNQVWWNNDLAGSGNQGSYRTVVRRVVEACRERNMRVILDLHRHDSDGNDPEGVNTNNAKMCDQNSKVFWETLATEFANDSMVIFELFNEPKGVDWDMWLNGGLHSDGVTYVGMQEIYTIVRATGANNFILIGGLDWAYKLDGVVGREIQGYNIGYTTHIYPQYSSKRAITPWEEDEALADGNNPVYSWEQNWLFLADDYPIVVTEFGPEDETPEKLAESAQIINVANDRTSGWTAWGFWWYKSHGLIQQTGSANWKFNPPAPTVWGQQVRDSITVLNENLTCNKAPNEYFTLTSLDKVTAINEEFISHEWTLFSISGVSVASGKGKYETNLPLPKGAYILKMLNAKGEMRTSVVVID